jgi:hypothetical protein
MVATLSPAEIARRWTWFAGSFSGSPVPAGRGTGFWFDPGYAAFLEGVRARTPEDATVVLVAPSYPDVYVYQAAYRLSPRRVVGPDREREASWVAAYRYQYRDVGDPNVLAVPGGALFRRR